MGQPCIHLVRVENPASSARSAWAMTSGEGMRCSHEEVFDMRDVANEKEGQIHLSSHDRLSMWAIHGFDPDRSVTCRNVPTCAQWRAIWRTQSRWPA
jgi:hypothetical protein